MGRVRASNKGGGWCATQCCDNRYLDANSLRAGKFAGILVYFLYRLDPAHTKLSQFSANVSQDSRAKEQGISSAEQGIAAAIEPSCNVLVGAIELIREQPLRPHLSSRAFGKAQKIVGRIPVSDGL